MAKILLVEDDRNLLEIYGARLMADGHEIVTAQDGEEGLAVASREKPDLIITDAMMPRVSGLQFLDILRSTPATADIKVIAMTALSQAEDRAQFEKLGVERFLVKSQVTLEDVTRIVSEVLNGSPAAAAVADSPTETPPTDATTTPVDTPPSDQIVANTPVIDPVIVSPVASPSDTSSTMAASTDMPVVEPPADGPVTPAEPAAQTDTTEAATPTKEEQSEVDKQIQSFIDTSPLVNTPPVEPTTQSAEVAHEPATDKSTDTENHESHPHDIAL